LCDPLERTHDAQHRLDQRKLWATFLSSFELRVAFHRRSPFFKSAKPFKNLSAAVGILSESHFNHILCFSAGFSQILTKLNAHSLFHFLGSSECDDDTLTVFIWGGKRMRKREYQGRIGRQKPEHALDARSYQRNNTSLDTSWTALVHMRRYSYSQRLMWYISNYNCWRLLTRQAKQLFSRVMLD
jgi:hypothetical protein